MRLIIRTTVVIIAVLLSGCMQSTSCNWENDLILDLCQKQVTSDNTKRLIFEGSEANYGCIRVKITDRKVIKDVWRMINNSGSGGRYYACGGVRVEFYCSANGAKPNAAMSLNCGGDDALAYVEDGITANFYDEKKKVFTDMYQCPGLHQYVLKFLEQEYNKQQEN